MEIARVDVIVNSPDLNLMMLRITTDEDLLGLGDGTLNCREFAVASYRQSHVAPLLVGRDAHRIEDTWQHRYRGAYWRRGPVTMAAIAAVDVALWDIKAEVANLPHYRPFGGASGDGIRAYVHASGLDLPELFDSIREHQVLGYKAIRVQTDVPGLGSVYGVTSSPTVAGKRYDYEPARRMPLPVEESWDTAAHLRHVRGVLKPFAMSSVLS